MADSSTMAQTERQSQDRTAVYYDYDGVDDYYYPSYAYHEYDPDEYYHNYNYDHASYLQHDFPPQKRQPDEYSSYQRPHQRPQIFPSPPATCPSSASRPPSDSSSPPSDSHSRSSASSCSPRTSAHEYIIHLPPIAKSPPWPRSTCTGGEDGFGFVRGPVAETGPMGPPTPALTSADPAGQSQPQPQTYYPAHTHTQTGQHANADVDTDADWVQVKKEARESSSRASACVASSIADRHEGVDEEEYEYCEARIERTENQENAFVILVRYLILQPNVSACLCSHSTQLRLSFLTPPFSFGAAIYTLFVLLFLTLTSPLRLCNPPFRLPHLQRILLPVLRYHQRLICPSSAAAQRRRERDPYHTTATATAATTTTTTTTTSPPSSPGESSPPSPSSPSTISPSSPTSHSALLVLIHVVSPFLILPLFFASWTAACFWVFAMVLGDPGGGTGPRRNDDGRAAVLAVRNWWRAWLGKADKPEGSSNNNNAGRRTKRRRRRGDRPEMREQAQ